MLCAVINATTEVFISVFFSLRCGFLKLLSWRQSQHHDDEKRALSREIIVLNNHLMEAKLTIEKLQEDNVRASSQFHLQRMKPRSLAPLCLMSVAVNSCLENQNNLLNLLLIRNFPLHKIFGFLHLDVPVCSTCGYWREN